MMKCKDFIKMLEVAVNRNTVYAKGMFGNPITENMLKSKANQSGLREWYVDKGNYIKLREYVDKGYFGFDCVCLIKGILWGWKADFSHTNGGAKYQSNNVPDWSERMIIDNCIDVSTNFSNICVGAFVYMKGHCGIYIGNGNVIEATPKWDNKVQISKLGNLDYTGDKVRTWEKWGKLPWVEYSNTQTVTYTVQKGDTLSEIAEKFDTTVDELATLNRIQDVNTIYIGQVLVVSQGKVEVAAKPKDTIYTIKKGDSFYAIARKFAKDDLPISIGEYARKIAEYNGLYLNSTIYPGQTLKIPIL